MKFGNLITYTGKYLSKATAKAANGNLVFAHITGSATATGDDKDRDGYYIYAGGAEALLVTKEDFNVLKADVAALSTKVGDLTFDGTTYADVPAYVSARLIALENTVKAYADSLVENEDGTSKFDAAGSAAGALDAAKAEMTTRGLVEGSVLGTAAYKDVAAGVTADEQGLTTGAQVHAHVSGAISGAIDTANAYADSLVENEDGTSKFDAAGSAAEALDAAKKYADDEIGKLGTVMSFIGVVELAEGQTFDTTNATVTINGVDKTAENGDVVIVGDKEYVWDGTSWKEFGDASAEGAAISELEGRVDTLEATVSGNVAAIAANSGAIAANVEAISGAVGRIDTLEATVSGNVAAIATNSGAIATNAEAIAANAEAISAHIGAATDAHAASAISVTTIEGKEDTVDNVQAALADLYAADKVASEGLNDLNERLDDLSGALGAISVTGDAASHSVVEGNAAEGYVVKNTLAVAATGTEGAEDYVPATAGLVTDSYLDNRLAWEVLAD